MCGIFTQFESLESVHFIREYRPSKHQNIKFSVEHEDLGSFSFFDVEICENAKFVSVYRNPTLEFSPIMKVSSPCT